MGDTKTTRQATARAFITGGAGFIGSHLTEFLISESYDVSVLDDLSTGAPSNLAHLNGNLSMKSGDVADAPLVDRMVRESDIVFHLAASVGVRLVVDHPIESILTNITGTEVVLEAAAKYDKPIFIASTSEVYGKSEKVPFREDDDLLLGPTKHLRWGYAASKAIDEYLTLAYVRDRGLDATIVRLFNTVGRRQTSRYGMVIPTFVRQALNEDPITIHGDGTQRRAFAHVDDVVRAIYELSMINGVAGEVFNIGNDFEISISDLADLVRDRAKSESLIVTMPYDVAWEVSGFEDIQRRVPDLTKIRSWIGYEPKWTIEEIVDDVIDHFRTRPDFS